MLSDGWQRITVKGEEDLGEITSAYLEFVKDNTGTGHELQSLCMFMLAGIKTHKIETPVEILKEQSPDFRFRKLGEEVYLGLEHTRATVAKYKMDESEFEKYPEGSLMELPYYTLNGSPAKRSNIALKKPGEELTSVGWGDYGIEKQWVEIIFDAIEKKTEALNKDSFAKFARNELLVEDDGPVSVFCRFDSTIRLLREKQPEHEFNQVLSYDKVHIYSCDKLIYDIFGEQIAVGIPKNNAMR